MRGAATWGFVECKIKISDPTHVPMVADRQPTATRPAKNPSAKSNRANAIADSVPCCSAIPLPASWRHMKVPQHAGYEHCVSGGLRLHVGSHKPSQLLRLVLCRSDCSRLSGVREFEAQSVEVVEQKSMFDGFLFCVCTVRQT